MEHTSTEEGVTPKEMLKSIKENGTVLSKEEERLREDFKKEFRPEGQWLMDEYADWWLKVRQEAIAQERERVKAMLASPLTGTQSIFSNEHWEGYKIGWNDLRKELLYFLTQ